MAGEFTRSVRKATPEELVTLQRQLSVAPSLGCLLLVVAPFLIAFCFAVGKDWRATLIGAIGVIAPICVACSIYRDRIPIRARIRRDINNAEVELLYFSNASVWEITADHSSVDPAFAIELSHDKVMIVLGPWLCEPETYGGTEDDGDEGDEGGDYANHLVPPFAFPTSEFSIQRFPHCGDVLQIGLIDTSYCKPNQFNTDVDIDITSINHLPSIIVDSSIEDLPQAVGPHLLWEN